jgi:hypothetical protein
MHRISRETLRKHAIDSLPWEGTDDNLTGSNNSNKKAKMATTDGAILRPEERNAIARDVSLSSDSGVQPPYKTTGMNSINNDEGEIYNITPSSLFLNSNDIDKFSKPSEPKVNKMRTNRVDSFFARVDELKAFKGKHGHLNIGKKENESLYRFCIDVRRAQKAIISGKGAPYKLTDDRIAALDAIGFNWNPGTSSTAATKDDKFFARVDKLKAYKDKHGHLNVRKKEDKSLYDFCYNVRRAQRDTILGKGTDRKLTKDRIAALDAIGFEWEIGAGLCFFDRVDELKAYKEKHGHLNVRQKENQSLYGFCSNMRQARKGKKGSYRLDNGRIAALDAIGFDWEARASSTAASQDDRFLDRVEELRAYKAKHGHLKVTKTVDLSLHTFCNNVRQAQRAIITGKGTKYILTEDRIAALDAIGFIWNPLELEMSSTSPSTMSKISHQATNPKINIGDVGYQFRKEFDSGWYYGTVAEILQDADDGWDRRCVYEDGDCEDLSLSELKRLATLSPQEHVGAIEVMGDVKMVEDGGMKVAASVGESILAAKVNPVIQKAARLKHRPVSKTTTSSTDDLFLTKNSKSSSNNNKAMATDLASLSSVDYDHLTIRELKQVPELTQHIVAIEEVLRNMRRG